MEEITSAEMAVLDENCRAFGLSPLQLMENAGAAVARAVVDAFVEIRESGGSRVSRESGVSGASGASVSVSSEMREGSVREGDSSDSNNNSKRQRRVLVIAGKGNNGGDGFVAARHLLSQGYDVRVVLLAKAAEIKTEEARRNYEILKACGCKIEEVSDALVLKRRCDEIFNGVDVIVDAIFGTGFRGKPRELEATAIDAINNARRRCVVVAVDVPSGLDSDTGDADKAVRADVTVTFHKAKPGLKKSEIVGKLVVASIGIPPFFEKLAGPGDLRIALRKRRAESHKGEFGRILIVGGGPFAGAPAIAALAALRTGADWVTVAAPQSVARTIAGFSPNIIVHQLSSDVLVEEDVETVVKLAEKHDVMLIGNGLGDAEETKNAVRKILECVNGKIVVDADGFYGVSLPLRNDEIINKTNKMILTPHSGEFLKMGVDFNARTIEEKETFVRDFSAKNGVVTLLKGHIDIISDGKRLKINRTGNAGMTVGGTGDVLAGIVAALFAVNDDAFRASVASAYLCGVAGDVAFSKKGDSLLATDVIECIPDVLASVSALS